MNADSGIVNTHSGEWQKVFTFDQNPCSRSFRIAVHVRPERVFTLPQNMHIEPSVGSKGDSYDNALAETINGLYKAELIHRRAPWKTKADVELATLEWVTWFNHQRLLEPIGYIPPAQAEANYYQQLAEKSNSAVLT